VGEVKRSGPEILLVKDKIFGQGFDVNGWRRHLGCLRCLGGRLRR